VHALVGAELLAADVHEVAAGQGTAGALDDGGVVSVGDEADRLAVGLLGHHRQAGPQRQGPHQRLVEVTEGKQQVADDVVGRAVEPIGLIAAQIARPGQGWRAVSDDVLHVVAGGQGGVERAGGLQQVAELHLVVAGQARDGRAPGAPGLDEGIEDGGLEAVSGVDGVEAGADDVGHAAGVGHVVVGAAAAVAHGERAVVVGGQPQRHADHLVPLLLQQPGGDAGVDAAGEGHDDAAGDGGAGDDEFSGAGARVVVDKGGGAGVVGHRGSSCE
jgi:hypothetical protein